MKMTAGRRALDKIYKRRNRYEVPDWQRGKVWDTSKKQQLIDSILRGWKLPKFYFVKVADDEFEVVDGQQRLNAIFEFFAGELPLPSGSEFGGPLYSDLTSKVSDAFDDFEIEYDEIEDADDKDLKLFFQRLQQGLPLTASERLNSVHSKLRDFCKETAEHAFLSERVAFPDTRFAHFDVVSKTAAIELEGIETGLRFDDMRGLFEDHANFSGTSAAAKRLQQSLDYLERAFTERSPYLKNRTIVQSLITLTSKLVATGKAKGKEKVLANFVVKFMTELTRQVELGPAATDADFLRFQRSVNANVKAGPRVRQEILMRKLFAFEPDLANAFDVSAIAASGVLGRVSELGENIRDIVETINERYAAKHGGDFFKATTKTAQALVRIGKPIKSFADYKDFVDHAYFLFRESAGERLKDKWPASFADVNTLRTELRHDVDHGDLKKVKAKKQKAGKVFESYAGVASPQSADPTRFPLMQANLLTALENDLRTLAASM